MVLKKILDSPLDCKEIKPLDPKGNQPWIFTGLMLKLKLQYCGHLIDTKSWLTGRDPEAGKDWRHEEKEWHRMRWLDGITNSMDISLSKLADGEGQGSLAALAHGVAESQTWLGNWTTTIVCRNYSYCILFILFLLVITSSLIVLKCTYILVFLKVTDLPWTSA